MIIKGTEGYLPIQNTAVQASIAATSRRALQKSRYDRYSASASAQQGGGFRELAASLAYQVRTHNTTGKIQELRSQVRSGQYSVEPRETAARMLLLAEESE